MVRFIAKEGSTVNINQGTLTVAKAVRFAGVSDDVATSSSVKNQRRYRIINRWW